MKQEIFRKLIHLSSLWIPVLYLFTDKGIMLTVMVLATLLVMSVELGRHHLSPLEAIFQTFFGPILRKNETARIKKFTGATPLLLASTLTIALFAKPVALAAISILILADTMAALVGKSIGKRPLAGKTWEGTAAFAATAFITCLCFGFGFLAALVTALVSAATELYSPRIKADDNFTIPLAAGLVLTLLA